MNTWMCTLGIFQKIMTISGVTMLTLKGHFQRIFGFVLGSSDGKPKIFGNSQEEQFPGWLASNVIKGVAFTIWVVVARLSSLPHHLTIFTLLAFKALHSRKRRARERMQQIYDTSLMHNNVPHYAKSQIFVLKKIQKRKERLLNFPAFCVDVNIF